MDPVTPAKYATLHHEAHVDGELPPLIPSMLIEGLPPFQQSMFTSAAKKIMMKYAERWQIVSFDSYCLIGHSSAAFFHPGAISVDRLVAIGYIYGLMFLLDDLFFDTPDDYLLGQYGIAPSTRDSPQQMREYLDNLMDGIFAQQSGHPHSSTSKIEMIFWELGRDMLRLSNPDWFRTFVAAVVEFFQISVASHVDIVSGRNSSLQDVQSYGQMRAGNVGAHLTQLLTEFGRNDYLPEEMRSLPIMLEARDAASLHFSFVNDIYSYHKESTVEKQPRNVITVLMESEGKTFVQAVHAAIGLVNSYARTILDLELKTANSAVQHRKLKDVKAQIAGNIFFSSENIRYRHPDSVFPELRDVTVHA